MGLIIAGHTNSYYTYTFEEALEGIARAGYKYAELTAVPDRNDFVRSTDDPERVREKLASVGLESVSMSLHLEPADQDSFAVAQGLIDWAGRYGLDHLNCALGDAPTEGDGWLGNLATLADHAADAGVSLNVEVHGPLAPTGRAAAELIDGLGHEALGVNYDTGNVEFYGGIALSEDLPHVRGYVRHVHLKDKLGGRGDWAFPALGGGHVDFSELLGLTSGARGLPLSVELEFHGDPWPSLAVVNDAMRVSLDHLAAIGFQ